MYAHRLRDDSPRAAMGGRVRITYTNAYGESSIRVVEPERIYPGRNGFTYLRAFCHLRGETRTFRFDRIGSWEPIGSASPPGPAGPLPRPVASRVRPAPKAVRRSPPPPVARQRHPLRVLLVVGGIVAAGRFVFGGGSATEGHLPSTPPPAPPAASTERGQAQVAIPQKGRPQPERPGPQPAPPRRLSYRGVDIVATGSGQGAAYSAPAWGLTAGSLRGLHLQLNALLFRRATAIADPALERLYADADTDRDGYLCWKEIRDFQRLLTLRYRYLHNSAALRPDQFLSQGGGDCEDWALLSCGLLRYWGWESYVGGFFPPEGGDGHAMCLVRWAEPPRGFDCLRVADGVSTWDGQDVRPGYYVPVDYELVGGTSNAIRPGWSLRHFYTPEAIYGAQM